MLALLLIALLLLPLLLFSLLLFSLLLFSLLLLPLLLVAPLLLAFLLFSLLLISLLLLPLLLFALLLAFLLLPLLLIALLLLSLLLFLLLIGLPKHHLRRDAQSKHKQQHSGCLTVLPNGGSDHRKKNGLMRQPFVHSRRLRSAGSPSPRPPDAVRRPQPELLPTTIWVLSSLERMLWRTSMYLEIG